MRSPRPSRAKRRPPAIADLSRGFVKVLGPCLVALGWLALRPEPVWAWGPATHVALGEVLLGALYLVPPAVQALLERFPLHFLYGSIAADISLAKKYVPEGRHCHNWDVGEEILSSADSEPLAAVGYGYLAHLAADTIAHNIFIPSQVLRDDAPRGRRGKKSRTSSSSENAPKVAAPETACTAPCSWKRAWSSSS